MINIKLASISKVTDWSSAGDVTQAPTAAAALYPRNTLAQTDAVLGPQQLDVAPPVWSGGDKVYLANQLDLANWLAGTMAIRCLHEGDVQQARADTIAAAVA